MVTPVVAAAQPLARTVEQAVWACDFERPLETGDRRYLDLAPGRGDQGVARLRRRFATKPAGRHLHIAFASHRGAGKSTELNRLASAVADRYLCLYFQANVEMDPFTVEAEDLLLVFAQMVEQEMRAAGLPPRPSAWSRWRSGSMTSYAPLDSGRPSRSRRRPEWRPRRRSPGPPSCSGA